MSVGTPEGGKLSTHSESFNLFSFSDRDPPAVSDYVGSFVRDNFRDNFRSGLSNDVGVRQDFTSVDAVISPVHRIIDRTFFCDENSCFLARFLCPLFFLLSFNLHSNRQRHVCFVRVHQICEEKRLSDRFSSSAKPLRSACGRARTPGFEMCDFSGAFWGE